MNLCETFRDLDYVECIAGGLESQGIHAGDLVALAIPNPEDLLLAVLGVLRVTAAAPLSCKLAQPELQSRLAQLKPRALVTAGHPDPALTQAAAAAKVPILALRLDEDQPQIVPLDVVAALPSSYRTVSADTALVLPTSGTTGAPKLAAITHRNLTAMIGNVRRSYELTTNDRLLCLMPLYHLGGLLSSLAQLSCGGTVICGSSSRPANAIEWIETYRPTWYLAAPAVHRSILQLLRDEPDRLPQHALRFIRSGSAAIPPDLVESLERSFGVPVIHGYGMTEAGVITSTPFRRRVSGSIGKSIGPTIEIRGPGDTFLPVNVEGEIVLRGDAVISAYLDDPQANRTAFYGGSFRTGDLGRLNADGELFITGRLRDMINRGGEKILPQDIDSILEQHPAVKQAAAFPLPHPTLGEEVAVAIVFHSGSATDEGELIDYMTPRIAPSKLPSRVFLVDEIPGDAGKPRRNELSRALARVASASRRTDTNAVDPLEERLTSIFARVLGLTGAPDPNANFFSLGGDSLSLLQVFTIVESEIGVDARLLSASGVRTALTAARLKDEILKHRTITALPPSRPRVSQFVLEAGNTAPFFCFPGATLDAHYLRPLASLVGEPFVVLCDPSCDARGGDAFEELIGRLVASIVENKGRLPRCLGGHCFGGILAFECARRLEALGYRMPLVVLFDTATPGYPKPLRHWNQYAKWGRHLCTTLRSRTARQTGREVVAHFRYLSKSGPEPTCTSFKEAAAAHMRRYVPRPFGGRVVSFVAGHSPVTSRVLEDARLGWRDFAQGGFESYIVPGGHDSMFSEEHVSEMANLLRGLLTINRVSQ
jgi:acyl-CoA synthetase (AMP-forming)/AMP-acid ligase II/thioesterase domain-containing protein/acyl carrier protein